MTISAALTELLSVANAPLTAAQRESRAQAVLTAFGVTVADITATCHRTDLPFNVNRARAFGISDEDWQTAMHVSVDHEPETLDELLEALRRAEAAAGMLRSGYRPVKDASGKVNWTR